MLKICSERVKMCRYVKAVIFSIVEQTQVFQMQSKRSDLNENLELVQILYIDMSTVMS